MVRERRKREAESAFDTGEGLLISPPHELTGARAARAAWRSLMRAHAQLPGELFSSLDRGFLIGYCLAVQARKNALDLERSLTADYKSKLIVLKELLAARVELRQATRLVADLEKQLYATPKARGGVTPGAKQLSPEELIDRELNEIFGGDDDG